MRNIRRTSRTNGANGRGRAGCCLAWGLGSWLAVCGTVTAQDQPPVTGDGSPPPQASRTEQPIAEEPQDPEGPAGQGPIAGQALFRQFVAPQPGQVQAFEFRETEPELDPKLLAELAESKYWVGVQCKPAEAPVLAQIGAEHGLLVEMVVPDGPSGEAIRQYDVLVQAGQRKLEQVSDLVQAVQQAGDQSLEVKLYRQGESITVEITPQERPQQQKEGLAELLKEATRSGQWAPLTDMAKALPGGWNSERLNMYFVKPAIRLPGSGGKLQDLPEDVTIRVEKQGAQPAEITVERGDEEWKVQENKLDDLPPELRAHVEQMLGSSPAFGFLPPMPQGQPGEYRVLPMPAPHFRLEREETVDDLKAQLQEQLKALHEELQELRQSLPEIDSMPELKQELQRLKEELDRQRKKAGSSDEDDQDASSPDEPESDN